MTAPPEDVVAFTRAHSRSYTALAAMHRLGLRPRCPGVLRLLCLGADRREGTSPEATAAVFGALRGDARLLGAFPGCERTQGWTYDEVMRGVERIEIALVGPNVTLDARVAPDVFHDVRDDDGRRFPTRVAYARGLYHELERDGGVSFPRTELSTTVKEEEEEEGTTRESRVWVPDLALAYNAGVWGYAQAEWAPTFFALTRHAPVVCTGYSARELEGDEECLELMRDESTTCDEGNCEETETEKRILEFAWACEPNPFASLEPRALQFSRDAYDGGDDNSGDERDVPVMRENDAWLCVARERA